MSTGKVIGASVLFVLFGSVWISAAASGSNRPVTEVTGKIEFLGNPYAAQYPSGQAIYARNIWCLQAYQGCLYIGAGNSSNNGPAQNAGPVPIYCYDPATGKFEAEFTVEDEQVDVFYTFSDGQLYTPGHDPKENWDLGNFYRRELDGKWHKYRNIPHGIHTYAMAWWEGNLFAGLGSDNRSDIVVSKDHGLSWVVAGTGLCFRVHSFIECAGRLYGISMITPSGADCTAIPENVRADYACLLEIPGVSEWNGNGTFEPRRDLTSAVLFPDTDVSPFTGTNVTINMVKVVRSATLQAKAVFIGAYCHNDHQSLPFGVYVASSLRPGAVKIRRVDLPDSCRPWDLIVRDGLAYVLLEKPEEQGCSVRVLASKDLKEWSELFRFHSATFARSFELLDGTFYFGLGCEVRDENNWRQEELHPDTGNIISLKVKELRMPKEE